MPYAFGQNSPQDKKIRPNIKNHESPMVIEFDASTNASAICYEKFSLVSLTTVVANIIVC
jgi:hypothetical protein